MWSKKAARLIEFMPDYPHYKMNIFSGTNSIREFLDVTKAIFRKEELVYGSHIDIYTKRLREYLKKEAIYPFASGRMGFYTILKSIGINAGDEVIIPAFTCIVVPNAIIYSGAKPIYCDISSKDFNIDVTKIEALITEKTRVLYAQHTFGQMCDIKAIKQLAQKYDLLVIEDAALALGASLEGNKAGTIGDFGYFSTDRSKVINTGLGGFVSVNNVAYQDQFENLYEPLPYLNERYTQKIARTFLLNLATLHPSTYWIGKSLNFLFAKLGWMYYFDDELSLSLPQKYPYPAKLSNIFAKIGGSQMDELTKNLYGRREKAKYYNDILKIYTDEYMQDPRNIFLRYSLLVKNRDAWEKRFASIVELSSWFKSVTQGRNSRFEEIFYQIGSCEIAEFATAHILNFPTHNNIKPQKMEKVLMQLLDSGDIITEKGVL
jgi:dTDP-4-amino-4,6-dideoxygalactose transaminase